MDESKVSKMEEEGMRIMNSSVYFYTEDGMAGARVVIDGKRVEVCGEDRNEVVFLMGAVVSAYILYRNELP